MLSHLMQEEDDWAVIQLLTGILQGQQNNLAKPLFYMLLEKTVKIAYTDRAIAEEKKEQACSSDTKP